MKRLAEVTGYDVSLAENLVEATSDNGAYVFENAKQLLSLLIKQDL